MMKLTRKLSILFVSLVICFAGWRCTLNNQSVAAVPIDDEAASAAALHYRNFCAGCHGANMEEFADQKWMFANSAAEIEAIIAKGEDDMGCPALRKL
jgi:mono/diheme cytochrome c family protein